MTARRDTAAPTPSRSSQTHYPPVYGAHSTTAPHDSGYPSTRTRPTGVRRFALAPPAPASAVARPSLPSRGCSRVRRRGNTSPCWLSSGCFWIALVSRDEWWRRWRQAVTGTETHRRAATERECGWAAARSAIRLYELSWANSGLLTQINSRIRSMIGGT